MTERDALCRSILNYPDDDTPRLVFADWLDENGEPERAEFIRVQVELWRIQSGAVSDGYSRQVKSGPYGGRFFVEPAKVVEPLLSRERDIFKVHGAEWFGANITLSPPNERERHAPGWWCVIPARGFPSHWYGSWDAWIGGEPCGHCTVRGERVDREFWLNDSGSCPGKCIDGRIPGACGTIAWRPEWMMECEKCKGEGRVESPNPQFTRRCPECEGRPGGDDYRCSGRAPRPCPPGAVPLTDVTLTTRPNAEWISNNFPDATGRLFSEVLEKQWPGLRFHLPSERRETIPQADYDDWRSHI